MGKYSRTFDELKDRAAFWWPEELKEKNIAASMLPLLLSTQEDFLNILNLAKKSPFQVFDLIVATKFPANLFLKHLTVLADYGGEPIQRLGRSFIQIFEKDENGRFYFEFLWKRKKIRYTFKKMPVRGLSNPKLAIDGKKISQKKELDDLTKDMIAILLFAAASGKNNKGDLDSCMIGDLIGRNDELEKFVRQRYIQVSKITSGARSNRLGHLAELKVFEFLKERLGEGYTIQKDSQVSLPGIKKDLSFDVVVEKNNKKVGIEVGFQVTTNSVIERKAAQAPNRKLLMTKNGNYIAYVLDGAGNFQRSSAVTTICKNSDCTVAFSNSEFELLVDWIKTVL